MLGDVWRYALSLRRHDPDQVQRVFADQRISALTGHPLDASIKGRLSHDRQAALVRSYRITTTACFDNRLKAI